MDKKKLLLRILVVVLAVVLVVMVAGVVALNYVLGKIGSEVPDDTIATIPPELEDDETDPPEETEPETTAPSDDSDPSDSTDPSGETEPTETVPPTTEVQITWPEVEQLYNENVINIMLIGHDSRVMTERARSDTMILLSINKNTNTIHLTSFMRDLYVQIPGGYSDNRMNAAYRFGGASLLDATLQKNFGITVDGNVAVNFNQFTKIIDVLGGVDIELSAAEASHLKEQGYSVSTGMNHLDGKTALAYCRIRKIDSDHNRTERQRKVLTAIANSARSASLSELMGLVNEVLPYVETDLTDSQIVSYTTSALSILSSGGAIQSNKVPQSGQYWGASIRGMSVMVPDLVACNQYLKAVIYGG